MVDFDNLPADDALAFLMLEEGFRQEWQATGAGNRNPSAPYSYYNKVAAAAAKLGIAREIATFEMPDFASEKFPAAFSRFQHLVERKVVEIKIDQGRRKRPLRKRGLFSRTP